MNPALRLLSTLSSIIRFGISMVPTATSNITPSPYEGWTRERLVERLMQLEGVDHAEPRDGTTTSTGKDKDKLPKSFDFSKHPRWKIALKFCYSGWEYSGLAHQIGPVPLPTVEN